MDVSVMRWDGDGPARLLDRVPEAAADRGWLWVDIEVDDGDTTDARAIAESLELDALAVHDAFNEADLPKVDDFGHHLLIVLHGLRDDRVATHEIDCFLTARTLVTFRSAGAPAVQRLWSTLQERPELAAGGADELAARLADGATRRLLAVVEAFDDRVDELFAKALSADAGLLEDVVAVRSDVAAIRRVVHPQREALSELRHSPSPLLSDAARRRFSDVFDVASRTASGLDAARGSLAEVHEAYRGAEARRATDVTKVLTVYAAVMLPLSLIAGFFGMNHPNLPGIDHEWGWIAVTGVMVLVAALSIGVFVALGWVRRPTGRGAGETLGRGLAEASRAPAQLAGAVYEISTMPLRNAVTRIGRDRGDGRQESGE